MPNTLIKQKTTRNASIDLFRFICAIMVVAIHTHPFQEINPSLHTVFSMILPRIAVPFFFCTSGFFYINKLLDGKKIFVPYFKKLITIYCAWSTIYIGSNFFRHVVTGKVAPVSFIKDTLFTFFINGSEYHFWFFPALIFSVCITTLFYKLKIFKALLPTSIVLFLIGCLGCSYYALGNKIPILSLLFNHPQFTTIRRIFFMAIPFFVCGHFVSLIKEKLTLKNRSTIVFTAISAILFFSEILILTYFKIQREIVITPFLYIMLVFIMLLLLKNPLPKFEKLSNKSKFISDFTYYSHPLIISLVSYAFSNVFRITITETPLFFITIIISFILGIICYRLKKDNIFRKIFF